MFDIHCARNIDDICHCDHHHQLSTRYPFSTNLLLSLKLQVHLKWMTQIRLLLTSAFSTSVPCNQSSLLVLWDAGRVAAASAPRPGGLQAAQHPADGCRRPGLGGRVLAQPRHRHPAPRPPRRRRHQTQQLLLPSKVFSVSVGSSLRRNKYGSVQELRSTFRQFAFVLVMFCFGSE